MSDFVERGRNTRLQAVCVWWEGVPVSFFIYLLLKNTSVAQKIVPHIKESKKLPISIMSENAYGYLSKPFFLFLNNQFCFKKSDGCWN